VQRHIKVLGIFCRLWYRDGKVGYLSDLPLTFEYVRDACRRYPELVEFGRWLDWRIAPLLEPANLREQARAVRLAAEAASRPKREAAVAKKKRPTRKQAKKEKKAGKTARRARATRVAAVTRRAKVSRRSKVARSSKAVRRATVARRAKVVRRAKVAAKRVSTRKRVVVKKKAARRLTKARAKSRRPSPRKPK
jgi:hypothetical protein